MNRATHRSTPESRPWWEPFYDEWLAAALLETTEPAELARTVEFLCERLELTDGDRLFDQCCGIGRLAIPLAARGLEVVGVDQCAAYIDEARLAAATAGLSVHFDPGDAFDYVPPTRCDAAINWWTSFGYAADDSENARMLERAHDSLRPGGRFALDFMNVPAVLRDLQRDEVTRHTVEDGDIVLHRRSRVDVPAGLLRKRWTYALPDGRRVAHDTAVRLYMPRAIATMMERVGFRDVCFFGSVEGVPLELDSPRCIIVARKPTEAE